MDADLFLQQFGHLAQGEGGVQKLRDLILQLAVRGKLVEQNPTDEPASELLKRVEEKKKALVKEGKLKKQKSVALPDDLPTLPRGWLWTSLDCLGEINPRNNAKDDAEIGFVPMTLISSVYGVQPDFEKRCWEEVKKGFTHFADRDVGIAKITPCFQNSKAAVFKGLPNGLGAGTTELHIFRDVTDELDTEYVYLFVKTPKFLSDGEKVMTGSAGQKRVPKDYILSTPFPLPPLAEQKRIVAKVDALMALCDRLEAEQNAQAALKVQGVASTLHHLSHAETPEDFGQSFTILNHQFSPWFDDLTTVKHLRATLLQLAVQGKLVPQDPSDEPASELLKRIEKERQKLLKEGAPNPSEASVQIKKQKKQCLPQELPSLPKGWAWATLMQCAYLVVDCHNKTAPYSTSGIPLLRTSNIRNGKLILSNLKYITETTYARWSARCEPIEKDILITREAPMGEVALIPDGMKVCMGQRMMLIRLIENTINHKFLLYSLQDPNLMDRVQDKPVGMTVKHLRVGGIETLLVPLPPLAEQQRIVAKVDALMQLCDQLEAHITHTRTTNTQLMDSLLHQMTQAA